MALKVQKTQPTGPIYADLDKPDQTVRFASNSRGKNVDGMPLTNVVSQVIINDLAPLTIGEETIKDTVSVRLRVSASSQSSAKVSELIAALAAQLTTWDAEGVFQGFPPETAPVIPVPAPLAGVSNVQLEAPHADGEGDVDYVLTPTVHTVVE
jgi:hypothetical protein